MNINIINEAFIFCISFSLAFSLFPVPNVQNLQGLLPIFPTPQANLNNSSKTQFANWPRDILTNDLLTVSPSTANELISIATWANNNSYKIRPSGSMCNFSPLTVNNDESEKILLVKTQNLNQMKIISKSDSSANVWVQVGATLLDFLTFLENNGYGLQNAPAAGDMTIGGAIATGARGSSVQIDSDTFGKLDFSYGSISNSILSLTALVWDNSHQNFTFKTFSRNDSEISAFLISLGKAFIIDVTFIVLPNLNYRCQSFTDISTQELFANSSVANSTTRSFTNLLKQTGRVELILFPFTEYPWVKQWSAVPLNGTVAGSKKVNSPANYLFVYNIPEKANDLLRKLIIKFPSITPTFAQVEYKAAVAGLAVTNSQDIWGLSKNVFIYDKVDSIRVSSCGYGFLTTIDKLQNLLFNLYQTYNGLIDKYAKQKKYPINGPTEIKINSIDSVIGLEAGSLKSNIGTGSSRLGDKYEIVLWFMGMTFPGTPFASDFYFELETQLNALFDGGDESDGLMIVEWAKGWAYANGSVGLTNGAWNNSTVLNNKFKNLFPEWKSNVETLNEYDPKNVFTNNLLNQLFK